ncbi:type II toxin-antitoxin system RelE/ParE family toxin [Sulfurimonas sp. SAG-AH-194-I05]|nr:type II toxin-antitoxin system RelE/ParE family toxin [Sulfurimonas sp. SAG-AH-194-I05]MDF1874233.1 type II toxin-antitoxin system RelE/ParE family toxin [Sulfurimonas sp. SAG-AH-194-I05]
MSYKLKFLPLSKKEWLKLDITIQNQFKKKLSKRLQNPKIQKDKLSGYNNIYKIKLRSAGFRLVYEVKDKEIVVLVLSVGKRENGAVYTKVEERSK